MTDLELNEPSLGERERELVNQALDDGFVSSAGPLVGEFESCFADFLGSGHAVATASGTAALHVGFEALGVGPGDQVAVSDLTFIASANAIRYTGAEVLLVDSEPSSWNIDGARLYDHIKQRARLGRPVPRVVEVVHILGYPAVWDPFAAMAEDFGIIVVEDAAESLGALVERGGASVPAGRLGTLGCFSFNGNKLMTTGAGGMVVTDDEALADRVRHLTTQAKIPGLGYHHSEIGFNYRLPALSAAVGLAQLERVPGFLARKHDIRDWYQVGLRDLPIELIPVLPGTTPSHWLISITVPARSRDHLLTLLHDAGIRARPIWAPLHEQAPYEAAARIGGEVAEGLARSGLSLPSSPQLQPEDVERVCAVLREALVGESLARTS